MARIAETVSNRCVPLVELIDRMLLECPVWCGDETPVRVLHENGQKKPGNSWMWCIAADRPPPEDRPQEPPLSLVRFEFGPGRDGAVVERLLSEFRGVLMSDAYRAYDTPAQRAGITHASCMAHVRRKFHDVLKADSHNERAREAMALIQLLYEVERRFKDASAQVLLEARQRESVPVMERLRAWLFSNSPHVMPKSALGTAISYAINRFPRLEVYLSNPLVPIDNNRVENGLRPFVRGRRAWLFFDQAHGAEASARLYTLIESAKANLIEPMHYVRFLLNCMERYREEEMPWEHLLPTARIRDYAQQIEIGWDLV